MGVQDKIKSVVKEVAICDELEKEQTETKDKASHSKEEEISADFLPGVLEITVQKASELVNKDMIGKSDPYVKIKFKDQEFKSRKVRNTLEPEWNFSANLIVTSSDENSDIVVEVYDDDFGKENFIGSYKCSLKHAIKETDKPAVWCNLVGCKSGKIFFSTIYSSDEEPATKSDSKEEKLIAEEQNENDKEPQEKEVTPKTDIKDDRDEKEKEISTEKDQSESASDDSSESSKSSEEKEDVLKEEKELVKLKSQEKEAVNERKETEVKSSETNEEKQITATKKEAKNEKSSDEIVAAGLDELDVNEIEENLLSEKEK